MTKSRAVLITPATDFDADEIDKVIRNRTPVGIRMNIKSVGPAYVVITNDNGNRTGLGTIRHQTTTVRWCVVPHGAQLRFDAVRV